MQEKVNLNILNRIAAHAYVEVKREEGEHFAWELKTALAAYMAGHQGHVLSLGEAP